MKDGTELEALSLGYKLVFGQVQLKHIYTPRKLHTATSQQ